MIWASGKKKSSAKKTYPELKYIEDREGYLSNYEKRRFRHKKQLPLLAEESAKCNVLPEGFKAVLFACEPDIVNPIDMCWDDKGRLYVAETVDYPNDMQKFGKGNDQIKICEDTDGDGVADKFTVFAKGLSIPTSICFANGGIIVAHAPDFLFLKDTDGDDKADDVKLLNSGWGIQDTHAGPSNLQYGLDNKIYGTIGYAGGPNNIRNGIFRMNLDGSNIEIVSNFNNNTWGLGISEGFEIFGSTANNNPAFHVAIPYRYYENAKIKKKAAAAIHDNSFFYPLIPVRQVDNFNRFTAGSGFNFYTARSFPVKYWNSAAFIGGPSGRLLGQFFISKNGSSYRAKNGDSLLASFDEYTSPIQAKTGPDGNVWMLDWSNLVIQHNPVPSLSRGGFNSHSGNGNAHWNPLRDKKHGRIYKIVHESFDTRQGLDLSRAETFQLIAALGSNNMLWRKHAQMKLIASRDFSAVERLKELLSDQSVDEIGLNTTVIHALWTLKGLNVIQRNSSVLSAVAKCLKHPSSAVRKNAVRVLPISSQSSKLIIQSGILNDEDAAVVRMALLSASMLPENKELEAELTKMKTRVDSDEWLTESWNICFSIHSKYSRRKPKDKRSDLQKKKFEVKIFKGDAKKGKEHINLCVGCHAADLNGDSVRKSPSLAGQNSWYIISQLQKYKAGIRGDVVDANAMTMQNIAKNLEPQQMADIAQYLQDKVQVRYKSLSLSGNVKEGAKIYQRCIPCHGEKAKGLSPFLSPRLTGLEDWYLLDSLKKYQSGERGSHISDIQGRLMKEAIRSLSKDQMKDVVAYIMSLQAESF